MQYDSEDWTKTYLMTSACDRDANNKLLMVSMTIYVSTIRAWSRVATEAMKVKCHYTWKSSTLHQEHFCRDGVVLVISVFNVFR